MTTPVNVLPEGDRPRPERAASPVRERLAAAAVALFVASGATAWALRDDPPPSTPVPVTATHAQLVVEATKACTVVTTRGYAYPQLLALSEQLHRFSVPGPDVAAWATALRTLDTAVGVEKTARAGAPATARQTAARVASEKAFKAAGIPACPG